MTLHVLPPPPSSVVKSVQYGTVTLADSTNSATATISSVDTSKAVVHFLGFTTTSNFADNQRRIFSDVTLTNSTTVTATRNNSTASNAVTVRFVVVEYY